MSDQLEATRTDAPPHPLMAYLAECRSLVAEEIRHIIPSDGRYGQVLYDLILDYPLREGKALRPALSIAACRALGGKLDAIAPTAAVLEMYHNAFLIHDDIEDDSIMRRGKPTLHQEHGVPIAVNVGDAMLSMCLAPLLENVRVIGLGPALRILEAISTMTRESVEGQAIELAWMRHQTWNLQDVDYVEMVVKKTGWYSFITPLKVGTIAAAAPHEVVDAFEKFALPLSVAFQIRDDVLNIEGAEPEYGKEIAGDICEGKRTLLLLQLLRSASPAEKRDVLCIMNKPRPRAEISIQSDESVRLLTELVEQGELTQRGYSQIRTRLFPADAEARTQEEVGLIVELMRKYQCADYALGVAEHWAREAERAFDTLTRWVPDSPHRRMLTDLVDYVHYRDR